MKQLWIGVGLLAVGVGAWYFNSQINMAKKLCVKPSGYVIKKLSAQGTIVTLYCDIKNLGAFEVGINSYDLGIYASGQQLAKAVEGQSFAIKPYENTEITIDVVINVKDFAHGVGNVLSAASNWKSIIMTIDGKVQATKHGLPFNIPVNYNFTIEEITSASKEESSC